MKRRDLLAAASITTVLTAGCLSGSDNVNGEQSEDNSSADDDESADENSDDIEYERCDARFVHISALPDPAEEEARRAIEDGEYEIDDRLLLSEVVNIFTAVFIDGPTYYSGITEHDGDEMRLLMEEIRPQTQPLTLQNYADKDVTANVRIELDGDVLVDESVEIEASEAVPLGDDDQYRFGSYYAEVKIEELELEDDMSWRVNESSHHSDISFDEQSLFREFQEDSSPLYCEWTDDGEVRPM